MHQQKSTYGQKSVEINNRAVGADTVADLQDAGKWKFGYGLEIGNMFRLVDSEPIAIGLKLTWLDFGFAGFKKQWRYLL